MVKKVTLLASLFIVINIEAQIQNPNNDSFNELVFFVGTNNPLYNNAEGSRYLGDEFIPAKINDIKETQLLRFNVVENTIEIRKNDGDVLNLSKKHRYVILLLDGSDRQYETLAYKNEKGETETTFFEKIHRNPNFTLYLKERIKYIPAKPERSSYEKAVPAKFIKANNSFYVIGLPSNLKGMTALPRKRKDFLGLFGTYSQTIEKMIKKEKLDIGRREDIVKILEFYFKNI